MIKKGTTGGVEKKKDVTPPIKPPVAALARPDWDQPVRWFNPERHLYRGQSEAEPQSKTLHYTVAVQDPATGTTRYIPVEFEVSGKLKTENLTVDKYGKLAVKSGPSTSEGATAMTALPNQTVSLQARPVWKSNTTAYSDLVAVRFKKTRELTDSIDVFYDKTSPLFEAPFRAVGDNTIFIPAEAQAFFAEYVGQHHYEVTFTNVLSSTGRSRKPKAVLTP